MALFSIYDGRASFWQWDVNQKLVVSDSTYDEIHFSDGTTEGALVCTPYIQDGICMVNVPNILLQTATLLRAFVYIKDKSGYRTTHTEAFTVIARPKPSDYIYTETETLTVEQAVQDALQDAKESGDFKGDPGPKGAQGPKGEPGADGYTPQKGVDYYTPEEKAELVKNIEQTVTGDIENALDELHAYAQGLIGGDA